MARARKTTGATADVRVYAKVALWGRTVGFVREFQNGRIGFEYDKDYLQTGVSLSPKYLPLQTGVFEFPELRSLSSFQGLPGALADSLPDTFGNLIIRKYFEERGESDKALSPVQRLLYIGTRAMGALEYMPALQSKSPEEERALEIKSLVESARRLIEGDAGDAVHEIMKVGGSAGGARAKALVLFDPVKNKIRSGFAKPRSGESHWLIKFDGVDSANVLDNRAKPYNRIEYTYALLAKQLKIDMSEVRFLEDPESGHFHFMTRRFDRVGDKKIAMHSLAGMTHVDYNIPQAYDYRQLLRLLMEMKLGAQTLEQAYRRMLFNIIGRNQDDHIKNVSFLMDDFDSGWRLSPAYDLTFAAGSGYTLRHQMTVGGLSDNFTKEGLIEFGKTFDIARPKQILEESIDAFAGWPALAKKYEVPPEQIKTVSGLHRFVKK